MQRLTSISLTAWIVSFGGSAFAQPAAPLIDADAAMRVSEHVHVIPDDYVGLVPNVGIIVGERATLIVDTGLGPRNGAIIYDVARRLGGDGELYIAATHFHPEHDLGAEAFPATAKLLRWQTQQVEIDESGAATIGRFSQISPTVAELLEGVDYRAADILFDAAIVLDLGGVRVRIEGVGPNHTRGDTTFFVVEDRVLFTGDTVMSVFPAVSAQSGDIDLWLENLTAYESVDPAVIVPAHGRLGDQEMIRRYRDYLTAVQQRTEEARAGGSTAEQAVDSIADGLAQEFADLEPPSGPQPGRIAAAVQAAYRAASTP